MDSLQLAAFIAVAEYKSFSFAAEKLNITQPAVSKRIASLEQKLKTQLFDRIARQVTLTFAGNLLLPRAYEVLQRLNTIEQEVMQLSEQVRGPLHLAISHYIALHRVPNTLKAFCQRFSQVSCKLLFTESEIAYQKVLQGEIELALITLSQVPAKPLHTLCVWQDPLRFVVAKDHPLASLPNISLAKLSEHPAILPGPSTFTYQVVKNLFDQHSLNLQPSMPTHYMEAIKMLVTIGLGWGVLPETMLDQSVAVLNLQKPLLSRQLGFVYHANRTLSKASEAFIHMIKKSDNKGK